MLSETEKDRRYNDYQRGRQQWRDGVLPCPDEKEDMWAYVGFMVARGQALMKLWEEERKASR
jgi:hypothetical protein